MENEIPKLPSDIVSENKALLEYSSRKYYFMVQLKEDTDNLENDEKIIVLTIENENGIGPYIFKKIMGMEDFIKLGKLFKLNDNIEEVYNFILTLLTKNNIAIKNIIQDNTLTLSLKEIFPGFEEPFIAEIMLQKVNYNKDDLITDLYRILEEKNKAIEEKYKILDEIKEKIIFLEEKNKELKDKNTSLEENNKTIEERYKVLEENNKTMEEKYKVLEKNNKTMEEKYIELNEMIKGKIKLLEDKNKSLEITLSKNNNEIPLYDPQEFKIYSSNPASGFKISNYSKDGTSVSGGNITHIIISNVNKNIITITMGRCNCVPPNSYYYSFTADGCYNVSYKNKCIGTLGYSVSRKSEYNDSTSFSIIGNFSS